MKSKKLTKQILMKGIVILMLLVYSITPIAYATTSLDDGYLESSILEKILYGTVGSTKEAIANYLTGHTKLYITNETQLRAFAEYVNDGNDCSGKEVILLNDIDVDSSVEWKPIGYIKIVQKANESTLQIETSTEGTAFKGTFNGNGHFISGITVNGDEGYQGYGLFGTLAEDGTIKNLIIEDDFNIYAVYDNEDCGIGNIVGYNCGTVENCQNKSINYTSEANTKSMQVVGGIVGYNMKGGTVKNCSNIGNISALRHVGGIAGSNHGTIINCINTGKIYSTTTDLNSYVGGIAGLNHGTISICKNAGNIVGDGVACVGGITGQTYNEYEKRTTDSSIIVQIEKCLNTGSVTGNKQVGGISGNIIYNNNNTTENVAVGLKTYKTTKIQNCTNSGIITANYYAGGIVGSVPSGEDIDYYQKRTENTYNGHPGTVCYDFYYSALIYNCTNSATATIKALYSYAGGITGFASNTKINACNNNGAIYSTEYIGGLVGETYYHSYIIRCYNSGVPSGGTSYVGGLVGYLYESAIDYCISNSSMNISGTQDTRNPKNNHINPYITNENGYKDGYLVGAMNGRNGDFLLGTFIRHSSVSNITSTAWVGRCIGYLPSKYLSSNKDSDGYYEGSALVINGYSYIYLCDPEYNQESNYEGESYKIYFDDSTNKVVLDNIGNTDTSFNISTVGYSYEYNDNEYDVECDENGNIVYYTDETLIAKRTNGGSCVISVCVDNYTKTQDTTIQGNKTYYIKNNDIYNVVNSPSNDDISNYYEYSETGTKNIGTYDANEDETTFTSKIKEAEKSDGCAFLETLKILFSDIDTENTSVTYSGKYFKLSDGRYIEYNSSNSEKITENIATDETIGFQTSEISNVTSANTDASVSPNFTAKIYVENELEASRYTAGKSILISITTDMEVQETEAPEIKVLFSKSGDGKYNNSIAKSVNAVINVNRTSTWVYSYEVQEGDEGSFGIKFTEGTLTNTLKEENSQEYKQTDLVGLETIFVEKETTTNLNNIVLDKDKNVKVNYTVKVNDNVVSDSETINKLNTGDKISVLINFNKLVYSIDSKIDKQYLLVNTINSNNKVKVFIDENELSFKSANYTDTNTNLEYEYIVENGVMIDFLEELKLETEQLAFSETKIITQNENEYKVDTTSLVGNRSIKTDISGLDLAINTTDFDITTGNYIYADTTSPDIVISASENSPTNADKIKYTFTASEKIIGFDVSDITVNNGTIVEDSFKEEIEGTVYSLEVTPNVTIGSTGNVQVIVEANSCQDLVAKGNIRAESNITIDKTAPIFENFDAYGESSVDISNVYTVKEVYKEGEKIKFVVTFSEELKETTELPVLVLRFTDNPDIERIVSAGTISDNKIIYEYTIQDGDSGYLTVKGFDGVLQDNAGNEVIVTNKNLNSNTIIADTDYPSLNQINIVSPSSGEYNAGDVIKIQAEFDEEIYSLKDNEINNVNSETAPILKLKFGTTEAKGNVTFNSYGKTEDNKDNKKILIYSYSITDGDNGKLSVISYANATDTKICDIAGNESSLLVNQVGNEIIADTIRPIVTEVKAEVEDSIIKNIFGDPTGNVGYYKAGNNIKITVKMSEAIYSNKLFPVIKVGFSENSSVAPTQYNNQICYIISEDGKEINVVYTVPEGTNGYLWVEVPEGEFRDAAGNINTVKNATQFENIYADTINPTITIYKDEETIQDKQLITVNVNASENIYNLDSSGDTRIELNTSSAPKLIYSFGTGDNKEIAAKSISGNVLTYKIIKDPVNDDGDFHYELAKGNLYDRAGNIFYDDSTDTTAPTLLNVIIDDDTIYTRAKEKTNVEITAIFDEEIAEQNIKLNVKFGDGEIKTIENGTINADCKTEVVFNYEIAANDNGKLVIDDVCGNIDTNKTGENEDNTYGFVKDAKGNQKNIYDITGSLISGEVIADTIAPTAQITTDVTNTNSLETKYTIIWSETVSGFNLEDIDIINGLGNKLEHDNNNSTQNADIYYLTVDNTNEGMQTIKIASEACEDLAGNVNVDRAIYNGVNVDYTKPIIRATYNGGTAVIATDTNNSNLKEKIVINERLDSLQYAWTTDTDPGVDFSELSWEKEEIDSNDVISDILINEVVENKGTYYLYIKAKDIAGNETIVVTNGFKVVEGKITLTPNTTEPTNEDITVKVEYSEGLEYNRKAGISGLTQSADDSKVIVCDNSTVYVEATDEIGNKVIEELQITNIDRISPTGTINYTENKNENEELVSVIAKITFDEENVTIINNNGQDTYTFTENGDFEFEFKDEAGNIDYAYAYTDKFTEEEEEVVDITPPYIGFDYTVTSVAVGNPIGATIFTYEDAKIAYSWDNATWTTSENYIRNVNVTNNTSSAGTYTLYAKATDIAGNTSEIEKLTFKVVASEENQEAEIEFNGLTTKQVDGVKYVIVQPNMTEAKLTTYMDSTKLNGKTPTYSTEILKTGTEIKLDGVTKYIAVILGDINGDGESADFINDIITLNRYRITGTGLTRAQILAGDINNDNVIDFIDDVIEINRYRIGIIKKL